MDVSPDSDETRNLSSYDSAYGEEVAVILADPSIQEAVEATSVRFADRFYDTLFHRDSTSQILSRLEPAEIAHLKRRFAQHFAMLLSPSLTKYAHFSWARKIGLVHERIGLDLPVLLEAYHAYQDEVLALVRTWRPGEAQCGQREILVSALLRRTMLDMEAQSLSHDEAHGKLSAMISRLTRLVREAANSADFLQGCVDILGRVDGVEVCLVARPDAQGLLRVEVIGGVGGPGYLEHLVSARCPPMRVRGRGAISNGTIAHAWRDGAPQVCAAISLDATWEPWQAALAELSLRSAAAVPLLDDSGQSFSLLLLFSRWPGFFNAIARWDMLRHVQQLLGHAAVRIEHGAVLTASQREIYRRRLRDGAVRLMYQPIVDLQAGTVGHFEALARLVAADGAMIPPGDFLPALGNNDLLQLFELGLRQVCRDLHAWREGLGGWELTVSINLPAHAITDDTYRDVLLETAAQAGIAPERIHLEVLETSDGVSFDERRDHIMALRQAGFRVVQDDLGSGHSSLLRMNAIPFDGVKIDQGLVRSAFEDPSRALEFICHLTALAKNFGITVTVEGLEDLALVEAAAVLGAEQGQGYAIARPMPAEEVLQWRERFRWNIDPKNPRTPLGAFAGYLLWRQQHKALEHWPELVGHFVRFPCAVQRYIDHHGLHGSALDELLKENHAVASRGAADPAFQQTGNELKALLGKQWRQQRAIEKIA